MPASPVVYHAAQRALATSEPLWRASRSKLARGLRARRRAHERLVEWARAGRDPGRACVWVQAPSVGEGVQARAVVDALRAERADVQVAFTHFSPSAEDFAARFPADVADTLPWDLPGPVGAVLDALAPDVVAFTKTEVWPTLVREAARRDIRSALVGASVPERAGRRSLLGRLFLGATWARLDLAAAIAEADAEALRALGVRAGAVHVTGDPAVDAAVRRLAETGAGRAWTDALGPPDRPVVVAGSTWPADERVLLPALARVRDQVEGLFAVVAPHEPTPARVADVRRALTGHGLSCATLAEAEAAGSSAGLDAVVVERVGALAELYAVGAAAFVGGGFGGDGLHSVVEPAAAGVPVAFGPRTERSRAAPGLIAAGAARVTPDAAALAEALLDWLGNPARTSAASAAARGYIRSHQGAAARTAALLNDLIRPSSPW